MPGGAVELLPADDFDPEASERRAEARREKVEEEIERLEKKLANERFVERAPAEVVDGERAKLEEYRGALERLDGTSSGDLPRGRGVPARPRAVRHAVRAGPR